MVSSWVHCHAIIKLAMGLVFDVQSLKIVSQTGPKLCKKNNIIIANFLKIVKKRTKGKR